MRPRITTFDDPNILAEAIDLYHQGASTYDLANKYRCGRQVVLSRLKSAGVTMRPRTERIPADKKPHLTPSVDVAPQIRKSPTPPIVHLDKMPWAEDALCRSHGDPAVFYPDRSAAEAAAAAKRICHHCQVREECLAWAIENDEQHGVWGGLTVRERRAAAKRSAAA